MAKAPAKTTGVQAPASYEDAQTELEALVARLESGEMPLEQLLSGYQRGAELLKYCREKLQAVEEQIKLLDAKSIDGGVVKSWTPR